MNNNHDYPTYSDIVADWGYEILASKTFGEWQGDYVYLLSHSGRVGVAIIGYGSCSGCDALEGTDTGRGQIPWREYQPIMDLSRSLRESIRWFAEPDDVLAWLESSKAENNWWYYDEEIATYVRSYMQSLATKKNKP
jgi:hypothetical protein